MEYSEIKHLSNFK